jgi:iron complex outermembrane recepter protein
MRHLRSALFLCASCLAAPAMAQDAPATHAGGQDDLHDVIVVSAAGLERLDIVAGTSVIGGTTLQREMNGQVGDILAKLPGVAASGFAPGVSRPILRGFGGDRVRVLSDGIGALDASGASDDHAVSIDPLTADRIEVLRGPAVLLYGNQAIGGAVNVITRRIPPRLPEEALHIDALASLDTASNLREGGVSLDAPLGAGFAAHVDGSWRQTDDLEIPGFAAAPHLREELLAAAEEEEDEGHTDAAAELLEAASISGVLPNSFNETYSLGAGLAWFGAGGSSFGVSFDYYNTDYGIPGLPGIGHVHEEGDEEVEELEEHGEEAVAIGLERYRADARATFKLGGGLFDRIEWRGAWSDYTHTEFEGDEVGTVFDVSGVETRLELVQARRDHWRGSVGAQFSSVDFAAIGAEAFLPVNTTENFAVFTVQEGDFGPLEVEGGARFEHSSVNTALTKRSFDTFSAALGGSVPLAGDFRAGFNLSRAQRAPSAQELFANGPHIATQQFELGDDTLTTESSLGAEAYLRGQIGGLQLNASLYRNWFDGFIYLGATGAEEDGLPVYAFAQSDADQFGFEAQATFPLIDNDAFRLLADLRGDYVRATLANGDPVPRIPPLSALAALDAQIGHFDARAELEWADGQSRVAPLEEPTDGYEMVNLSLAWHPFEGSENFTLMLQANNVFDVDARRHTSFTKEFVPLAGRNFRVSARASF